MWITLLYNIFMVISLLTYNILHNKALKMVGRITEKYDPDIMLFQEIETADKNLAFVESLGYKLADYANSYLIHNRIYGVATFYKKSKLTFNEASTINLPFGLYEAFNFLLRGGRRHRTILKTEFKIAKNNKPIAIYNIHLTAKSTNTLRERQMEEIFQTLQLNNKPIIVAGDFNYVYRRKRFEDIFQKYDLHEATNNIFITYRDRWLKLFPVKSKNDYVLYHNIVHEETERINVPFSDHYPLISKFKIDP